MTKPGTATAALMAAILAFLPLPAAAQDMLNYKGADREQKLIAGAKKEGAVVFYSAMIENQALRPIVDAFEKKYPFIHMTY